MTLDLLWWPIGIILLLNTLGCLYGYIRQTDKVTDLLYSLSFLAAVWSLLLVIQSPHITQWIVGICISVWAIRLGGYLFLRIHTFGRDKRFDTMRPSFWKFSSFWVLQTITILVILMPHLLLIIQQNISWSNWVFIGFFIWLIGFCIETIADWQKYAFICQKEKPQPWIQSGLWKYSRHPNYAGEILCWVGLGIMSGSVMSGYLWTVFLSIAWIYLLLRYVSGVPLLEKAADKQWGNDPKYQAYKRKTRLLL